MSMDCVVLCCVIYFISSSPWGQHKNPAAYMNTPWCGTTQVTQGETCQLGETFSDSQIIDVTNSIRSACVKHVCLGKLLLPIMQIIASFRNAIMEKNMIQFKLALIQKI